MLRYADHMTVREKIFQILRNPVGSLKERSRLARLLVKELPVFVVNSGNWAKYPALTLKAANVFPRQLLSLLEMQEPKLIDFDTVFPVTQKSREIGALFDKNGSDKTSHGYERIYSKFFGSYQDAKLIQLLEIGIGTNSHGLISSMGRNGKPGASLITFAEFDSRINVTGADIDRNILFTANHIKCFFIDQTELDSYYALASQVGIYQFDFIIDDGLHSTEANLNSLIFAQNHLAPGGYLIIEDIPDNSLPVWNIVIGIMRSKGHEISVTRATRCNIIIFRNSL
jgi:hypothetical protein